MPIERVAYATKAAYYGLVADVAFPTAAQLDNSADPVAVGDLAILVMNHRVGTSKTVSSTSGMTLLGTRIDTSTTVSSYCFYKFLTASDITAQNHTFTYTYTDGDANIAHQAATLYYRGVDAANPISAFSQQQYASAAVSLTGQIPAITPLHENTYTVVFGVSAGSATTSHGVITDAPILTAVDEIGNGSTAGNTQRMSWAAKQSSGGANVTQALRTFPLTIDSLIHGWAVALKPVSTDTTPPAAPTGLTAIKSVV